MNTYWINGLFENNQNKSMIEKWKWYPNSNVMRKFSKRETKYEDMPSYELCACWKVKECKLIKN